MCSSAQLPSTPVGCHRLRSSTFRSMTRLPSLPSRLGFLERLAVTFNTCTWATHSSSCVTTPRSASTSATGTQSTRGPSGVAEAALSICRPLSPATSPAPPVRPTAALSAGVRGLATEGVSVLCVGLAEAPELPMGAAGCLMPRPGPCQDSPAASLGVSMPGSTGLQHPCRLRCRALGRVAPGVSMPGLTERLRPRAARGARHLPSGATTWPLPCSSCCEPRRLHARFHRLAAPASPLLPRVAPLQGVWAESSGTRCTAGNFLCMRGVSRGLRVARL